MRFFSWLKAAWLKHKTLLTGLSAAVIGAAQYNFEYIRNLIPEKERGMVLFSFGIAVAIIGFLNSQRHDDDPPCGPPHGG